LSSGITRGTTNHTSSSVTAGTPPVSSSSRSSTAGSSGRISRSITSRIGSSITARTPSLSDSGRQARPVQNENVSSSAASAKTDSGRHIGTSIGATRPSAPTAAKSGVAPGGHAGTSSAETRSSSVGSRISKSEPRSDNSESRSRIGSFVSKRTPSVSAEAKQDAASQRSLQERPGSSAVSSVPRGSRADSSASDRRPSPGDRGKPEGRSDVGTARQIEGVREHRLAEPGIADRSRDIPGLDHSRVKKVVPETQMTLDRTLRTDGTRIHRYTTASPSYVTYYDRPDLVRHTYHYDYAYRDHRGLLCNRLVWPRYRVLIGYSCGPRLTFGYVYPYYHRKYIFVSLGGYWPFDYSYARYYWYGWHPYYWYGYYPIAREVEADTHNYYTYNYYNNGEQVATYQSQVADPGLFENLAEQQAEPPETTLADMYFEEAVKAFEVAEYNTAIQKFTRAMELAPDDMILPFALSQALIAGGQYSNAAAILRDALAKVRPDKEGVFYPRGLYPDEQRLLDQIDLLAEQAEKYSFDADLQLLLGYQLLGIGQTDRAVEPLMNARKDLVNADAAAVLFGLLEKVKTSNGQAAPEEEPVKPNPAPASSKEIIKGDTLRLKEGMMLTGLCALATTAGIRHFMHG